MAFLEWIIHFLNSVYFQKNKTNRVSPFIAFILENKIKNKSGEILNSVCKVLIQSTVCYKKRRINYENPVWFSWDMIKIKTHM